MGCVFVVPKRYFSIAPCVMSSNKSLVGVFNENGIDCLVKRLAGIPNIIYLQGKSGRERSWGDSFNSAFESFLDIRRQSLFVSSKNHQRKRKGLLMKNVERSVNHESEKKEHCLSARWVMRYAQSQPTHVLSCVTASLLTQFSCTHLLK